MEHQTEQLDELIDASLDFTLTGETLSQLAACVASDPIARDRFEDAMRSQQVLSAGAHAFSETAGNVVFPSNVELARSASQVDRVRTFVRRTGAVAAVLAFSGASWIISGNLATRQAPGAAEAIPVMSTTQSAFANYMQLGLSEGRILRELPPRTVELRTTESGMEVVYVRRLLERARVDDVYRVGQDELGRAKAVPMSLATLTPGQSL